MQGKAVVRPFGHKQKLHFGGLDGHPFNRFTKVMNMALEEKYGAIWNPPLDSGDIALPERFFPDLDLVTLIAKRADGSSTVFILKKGHDAQRRLPSWITAEDPAQFITLNEAEQYLASTIALLGGHY